MDSKHIHVYKIRKYIHDCCEKMGCFFLTSPKLKRTGTLRKIINNQIAKCAHMRVCVCMCVVCLYITMLRRKRHEDKWPCKCIISDACSSAKIVKRSSDKVCPSYSSFKPFESLNSLEVFCYMKWVKIHLFSQWT